MITIAEKLCIRNAVGRRAIKANRRKKKKVIFIWDARFAELLLFRRIAAATAAATATTKLTLLKIMIAAQNVASDAVKAVEDRAWVRTDYQHALSMRACANYVR